MEKTQRKARLTAQSHLWGKAPRLGKDSAWQEGACTGPSGGAGGLSRQLLGDRVSALEPEQLLEEA